MSRTRIKICGLYREQHVDYVNTARPDYAGFVFYPPSHRYVNREMMKRLREKLSHKIPAVGVFVNVPMEEVASYIEEGLIEIAQLHGAETEEDIRKLRLLAPKAEIWKAFKIRDTKTLAKVQNSEADRILLDNGYGTGSCFDWQLLKEQVPARPYLLAGGLRAENVEEALERFAPWGVDVSSGVETEKEKDFGKIQNIIEIIRSR